MRRKRAAVIMSRQAVREREDSGKSGCGWRGRRRRERNYHLRIVSLWREQERIRIGEMRKEIEGKKRRDRVTEESRW